MKRIFLFLLAGIVLIACNKDKFQTKPQIKIKSQNTETVNFNGTLRIVLEFTDKEGDVSDTIVIVRERVNSRSPITPPIIMEKLPTFPNTDKGEIQIDFPYNVDQWGSARTSLTAGIPAICIPGTGTPCLKEQDTLNLKFVLQDKAGNESDTAITRVFVDRF
ncbi:MAG TPA: hypothetical protein VFQ73_15615 [Flavisolibacter sp.]|nr:hypothetical protein [Flavisolibacter sp.]